MGVETARKRAKNPCFQRRPKKSLQVLRAKRGATHRDAHKAQIPPSGRRTPDTETHGASPRSFASQLRQPLKPVESTNLNAASWMPGESDWR